MVDPTIPTDDSTTVKKKVSADPLADAGLTVPKSANDAGTPSTGTQQAAAVAAPPTATPAPTAGAVATPSGGTGSTATPAVTQPAATPLAPVPPGSAVYAGQNTYTSTAPEGGVFDPGSIIKNSTTYGQVDDKGAQILPDFLKGMLKPDGSQADMSTIAAMMDHPEVLQGMTPEQFQSAMGYASAANNAGASGSTASGTGQASSGPPSSGAAAPGPPILTPPVASSNGAQQTPAQVLASMTNQAITPGRQTTANNVDPLSGVTTIDPTNDLRSAVITDTPDARTTDYGNKVDQAASGLTNPVTPSSRLSNLQSLVDSASGNLSNLDRFQLAQDKFKTFSDSTDPVYQKTLRDATRRAAAAGGLYSGKLQTDYGDLGLARSRDLDTQKSQLFQQALSDSVNDQLNKTNTLGGLEGQLSGQESNLRADTRANVGTLAGLEGQARSANLTGINDLRNERGFQVGQEQSAFDRQLQEYLTEQGTKQQNFNNGLSLLDRGEAGNPSNALNYSAAQINPGLDASTIAALAGQSGKSSVAGSNPLSGLSMADLLKLFPGSGGSSDTSGQTAGYPGVN